MKKLNKSYIPYLIFITILITGIQIYKDYGVSSDELNNRLKGTISLNYVGEKIFPKYLEEYKKNFSEKNKKNYDIKSLHEAGLIKYYGVTFDLPLYALELFLDISEVNKKYELRHLATFIFFFVSLIFFFKLINQRTNSIILSSTSVLILFLTPRIFANSFYNSKDMVFLSFFIIAIYYCFKFLKKQNNKNIILASLFCALAIDTRIAGIIIPFFLFFVLLMEIIIKKKTRILDIMKFFSLLILFVILFWPYLWENPIKNFIDAYLVISKYPINFEFLFNGSFVSTSSVPFYYHIQWILISTPIINIFLFFIGIGFFIFNFKKKFQKFDLQFKQDLFIFLILFSVIFLTIFLNFTSYDGWRHFYFVYPLILFFSVVSIQQILLFKETKIKYFLIFLVASSVFYNLTWIIKNHPHQNVYFNLFAGKDLTNRFQMDYWGLSYKQNLKKILTHELNNKKIKIYNFSSNKLFYHSLALENKERERVTIVNNITDAEYVVDNFNYRKKPNKVYLEKNFKILHNIIVDGNKINTLYKRK